MPTQDERLTTLEQTVALLQKKSSANIQDLNRNVTMLLGIASGQELDIKEIKIKLATMSEQQDAQTVTLNEYAVILREHSTILNEHSALLRQILERLPAK
jgi:hypothetical protein